MKTKRVPLEREFLATDVPREAVYLLHGFAGRPALMRRLARYLCQSNYAVHNWAYPSVRKPIDYHAARLRRELETAALAGRFEKIHFVTHSLGGIVVRQTLRELDAPVVGRVVMLGPPNNGSDVARAGSLVLGRVCPVLQELSTKPGSFVNRLDAPAGIEIGVIAASNDWVVRQRYTHLQTQRDHIVIRGDHLRLPLLRDAALQALHFLNTGSFHRAPAN